MATNLKPVFDTSVFSNYNQQIEVEIFYSLLLLSIVLFELVATSLDKSAFQKIASWRTELRQKTTAFLLQQPPIGGKLQKLSEISTSERMNNSQKSKLCVMML